MAKRGLINISKRTVDGLSAASDTVYWDGRLPGFGIRVYSSGRKVYVVQGRLGGKSRRVTIGRHGIVSAGQARRRAARIIGGIKSGKVPEPVRAPGPSVAELAARYFMEHVNVRCKPCTVESYRGAVELHILPALGKLPLNAVRREDVLRLHNRLRKTPGMANLVVSVLSRMFNKAIAWELVPEGSNPCRSVIKYRGRKRERFLTEEEFRRLGQVLSDAEKGSGVSAYAIGAIRLLILTGCRRNEILTLQWRHVNLEARELRLSDSKTGPRAVPLSSPAIRVLKGLQEIRRNRWVIPGRRRNENMKYLDKTWGVIRARAQLEDVRLHDLRHSFASRALALGESLSMIGKLLGHTQARSTARYAHLDRDAVQESAARVAASIGEDILKTDRSAAFRGSPKTGPRRRRFLTVAEQRGRKSDEAQGVFGEAGRSCSASAQIGQNGQFD